MNWFIKLTLKLFTGMFIVSFLLTSIFVGTFMFNTANSDESTGNPIFQSLKENDISVWDVLTDNVSDEKVEAFGSTLDELKIASDKAFADGIDKTLNSTAKILFGKDYKEKAEKQRAELEADLDARNAFIDELLGDYEPFRTTSTEAEKAEAQEAFEYLTDWQAD